VVANKDRIVTGIDVTYSNESQSIPHLVQQSERCSSSQTKKVMLDSGYLCHDVLTYAKSKGINLICPTPKIPKDDGRRNFVKSDFTYRPEENVYICPAGNRMKPEGRRKAYGKNGWKQVFVHLKCNGCPFQARCTKNKRKRVTRYSSDALKEEQRKRMEREESKKSYKQRQAMVEPVFSAIKGIQNLTKFRRAGLGKVTVEWALHCAAYNLNRYITLLRKAIKRRARGRNGSVGFLCGLMSFCVGLYGLVCSSTWLWARRQPSHHTP